jgi:hypothetical protein
MAQKGPTDIRCECCPDESVRRPVKMAEVADGVLEIRARRHGKEHVARIEIDKLTDPK